MAKFEAKGTVKRVLFRQDRVWEKSATESITMYDYEIEFEQNLFSVSHFQNGSQQPPQQINKGYFTTTKQDQKVFEEGKEATFQYEIKDGKKDSNGQYYQYAKLSKKWEKREGGGKYGGKKSNWKPEDKREGYPSFAVSYAKDLVVGGKIKIEQLPEEADVLFDTMMALHKKLKHVQKGEQGQTGNQTQPATSAQPQAQGNNNTAVSEKSTSPPAAQVEEQDDLPF